MSSLTIEELDDLIQTKGSNDKKIKGFLSSPYEANQLLGVNLALQHGWSYEDIIMFVLDDWKGFEVENVYYVNFNNYEKIFLSTSILFSPFSDGKYPCIGVSANDFKFEFYLTEITPYQQQKFKKQIAAYFKKEVEKLL